MSITDEEIAKANNVNIILLANNFGLDVRKVGRGYRSSEHPSLALNPNKNSYNWFSQENGSPVNLVRNLTGKTFQEAVKTLLESDFSHVTTDLSGKAQHPKEAFSWNLEIKEDTSKVYDYLVNERKLHPKLIQLLLDYNYIKQDVRDQAIFCWYRNGQVVGADIDDEEVAMNSEQNFGFNIHIGEGPVRDVYIFQSPIDLLSYWCLNPRITDCLLGSMSGLREKTVINFMEYANASYSGDLGFKSVHICVSGDEKGGKFWEKFQAKNNFYQENAAQNSQPFNDERPQLEDAKSWNEVLQLIKDKEARQNSIRELRVGEILSHKFNQGDNFYHEIMRVKSIRGNSDDEKIFMEVVENMNNSGYKFYGETSHRLEEVQNYAPANDQEKQIFEEIYEM